MNLVFHESALFQFSPKIFAEKCFCRTRTNHFSICIFSMVYYYWTQLFGFDVLLLIAKLLFFMWIYTQHKRFRLIVKHGESYFKLMIRFCKIKGEKISLFMFSVWKIFDHFKIMLNRFLMILKIEIFIGITNLCNKFK